MNCFNIALGISSLCIIGARLPAQEKAAKAANIYAALPVPSGHPWCTEQAGDDPNKIIGERCAIYVDCLKDAGFSTLLDRLTIVPDAGVSSVKKCNQGLYNAARTNPRIKGSKATQEWLTNNVPSLTEAKSFAVPDGMGNPR